MPGINTSGATAGSALALRLLDAPEHSTPLDPEASIEFQRDGTYTVMAPDPFVAPYYSFLLDRTPKAQPEDLGLGGGTSTRTEPPSLGAGHQFQITASEDVLATGRGIP